MSILKIKKQDFNYKITKTQTAHVAYAEPSLSYVSRYHHLITSIVCLNGKPASSQYKLMVLKVAEFCVFLVHSPSSKANYPMLACH